MSITLKDIGIEWKALIYEQYLDILNKFLKQNSKTVFLCGSFSRELLKEWSDIDLFILDSSIDELRQSVLIIEWVEIEIISCSETQLKKVLEKEKCSFVRRISTFLSSWVPIVNLKNQNYIIDLAKEVAESALPSLTDNELQEIKVFILKNRKVSEDYLKNYSDLSFYSRITPSLQTIMQYYFKLNRQSIPNWKCISESIRNESFKKMLNDYYIESSCSNKNTAFNSLLLALEVMLKKYK